MQAGPLTALKNFWKKRGEGFALGQLTFKMSSFPGLKNERFLKVSFQDVSYSLLPLCL